MKPFLIFAAVLAACGLLCFVAPHHRRRPESFKACTMGEIYRDILREMPGSFTASAQMVLAGCVAGMFAAFYPALLVGMVRWLGPGVVAGRGVWFVLGGLLATAGAAANLLAILISHMNFGFGSSSSTVDQTAFVWIIPLFQLVFAISSILIGVSTTCASLAMRLIGG